MASMRPASKCTALFVAHFIACVAVALFVVPPADAQQRVIVNPRFVQRFQRPQFGGGPLPDYSTSVPQSFCTAPGSCLRYLGDARCLTPTNTPIDNQGCMVGWLTTDPYDANDRNGFVQNGHIKAPTQVGIGSNLEGLSVPNGSAELNAENPGRLFQRVCLAASEVIPFSYSLGDPNSTPTSPSQARFGVFLDNFNYPGNPAGIGSTADSTVVAMQTMVPQSGTVVGPPMAGLYQIGFEAIQPISGAAGNYISNVSITLNPLVDFATATLQVTEGNSAFLLVRVNGTVPAGGINVSLQPAPGTASGFDFSLGTPVAFGSSVVGSASLSSNGAGGYLLFIPQGVYDANVLSDSRGDTATNPSGSVRIPIDTTADVTTEDNETFVLDVEAPGSHGSSPATQWNRATTTPCAPTPSDRSTTTIVDNDVDLAAGKSVSNATPPSGSNVTYTVTFSNSTAAPTVAPLTAHDAVATVSDPVPPGVTFTSWNCTATGGASCPGGTVNGMTSGSGPISGNATLTAGGGTITYSITAAVGASQCSGVTNTATVSTNAPQQEVSSSNNTAAVAISPVCPATLAVAKTDNASTYTPGSGATYTITVTNSGLGAAGDLTVTDTLPAGVTLTATPSCIAAGTATCGTITGTAGGNSFTASGASLATGAGNSLTYSLPVAFAPSMTTDPLVNTASASGSNAPLVSGSDSDTLAQFRVGIAKSSSSGVAQPGGTVSYTVTATNSGSVAAPNSTVSDAIPTGLTSFTWTCAASGGAVCPSTSGSGAISQIIATFPAGGSVQYSITAAVSSSPPATITNTATVAPPAGGVCTDSSVPPCSSSAVLSSGAIVGVQKSTTTTYVTPNGSVAFTVTATNSGTAAGTNSVVTDPVPAGIAGQTWNCAASGGAACPNASGSGALNETLATFPAGSSLTWTLQGTATATPPPSVTNTATIAPPAGGVCGTSCTATVTVPSAPVVGIQKTTSTTSVSPGGPVQFTVTASNNGSVTAADSVVTDPVPAGIATQTWTCTASGGAACPNASGSGALNQTLATFPAGSSVTWVIEGNATSTPPAMVTNTATITPPAGGVCSAGCTASVSIASAPVVGIQKTTSTTSVSPGGPVQFTVTASNNGSVAAANSVVSDPVPAGIATQTWTCTAAGGAACPSLAGSGALNETLATFPGGSSVTWTIQGVATATPPETISNTATISPPAGGVCSPSCSATAVVSSAPVVAIQKSSSTSMVVPNGNVSFTVTATNSSSVAAPNTVVSDPIASGIASQLWTCAASGGAVCPAGSGSGSLSQTVTTFPAGSSVTYTINAVASSAPPANVTNTATITPPSGGTCAGPCSSSVTIPAAPVVAINAAATHIAGRRGLPATFSVTISNGGIADANGTSINSNVPAGVTSYDWTCTASGGAVCPRGSASGAIAENVPTFPAGGSLTYTITLLVPSVSGTITSNVVITPPAGGICVGSCSAETHIEIAHDIPALGTLAQLLLLAGMAAAAILILKR